MEASINWTAYQYSTFYKVWTFSYDISNSTFYGQVKDSSKNAIADLTITKIDSYNISISLSEDTLNDISVGGYDVSVKEVDTTYPAGNVIALGSLIISDKNPTYTP